MNKDQSFTVKDKIFTYTRSEKVFKLTLNFALILFFVTYIVFYTMDIFNIAVATVREQDYIKEYIANGEIIEVDYFEEQNDGTYTLHFYDYETQENVKIMYVSFLPKTTMYYDTVEKIALKMANNHTANFKQFVTATNVFPFILSLVMILYLTREGSIILKRYNFIEKFIGSKKFIRKFITTVLIWVSVATLLAYFVV